LHFCRKKFLPAIGAVLICGMLFPGISEAASYTVKSGDCLWTIANRYKTTVAKLQQLNNISGSLIFPGQTLKVSGEQAQNPAPAPAPSTPAPQPSAPSSATYTVKSGDSLWAIANRYSTTVAKLQQLNNISGSLIFPGQVLKVSGGQASPTTPSRGGNSDKIIQTANRFLGVPYVYGGMSPSGFDCSGFVKYVYSLNGITLPRVACDQANAGTKIRSMSQLQPGDLVCFSCNRNGYVDHIGIYLGNNQIAHASSSSRSIVVSSLSGSWYIQTFVHGVRVL
jgi:cell wall-associated NlpC family hydrolase